MATLELYSYHSIGDLVMTRYRIPSLLLCVATSLLGCGDAGDPWTSENAETADRDAEVSQFVVGNLPPYASVTYTVSEGEYTAQATLTPWSSWWFPTYDDFLYAEQNGVPAPLQKYDTYAKLFFNRTTSAAAKEREVAESDHQESWAGLCYAWALASIMEPEPKTPRVYGSLRFEVGDLKALLLKTYEAVKDVRMVGDRNDNSWDDVYADVSPHYFHQVLLAELFQKQRAFIIDRDAGHEVWNMPIYRATTKITRDAAVREVMHVRTVIFVATPDVKEYDFVGTQATTREYTYDLRGKWRNNQFFVEGGSWTGASRADHPDFILLPPDKVERATQNPELDIAIVDSILGKTQ
jgi:hypothetical protein